MNLRQRIRAAGISSDSQANDLGRILINSCVKADLPVMEFVERVIATTTTTDAEFAIVAQAAVAPVDRFNLAILVLDEKPELAAAMVGAEAATLEDFDAIPVKFRKPIFESDDGGDFTRFEKLVNDQVKQIRAAITLSALPMGELEHMSEAIPTARKEQEEVSSVLSDTAAVKMKEVTPVVKIPAAEAKEAAVSVAKAKTPAELLHEELLTQSAFYHALQVAKTSLEQASPLYEQLTRLQQFIAQIHCLRFSGTEEAAAERNAYAFILADLVTVIANSTSDFGPVPTVLVPYFEDIKAGALKIEELEGYHKAIRGKAGAGGVAVRVTQGIDWLFSPMDRYDAKAVRAEHLVAKGVSSLLDYVVVPGSPSRGSVLEEKVTKASEYGWWSPSKMAQMAKDFSLTLTRLSPTSARRAEVATAALAVDDNLKGLLQGILEKYPAVAERFRKGRAISAEAKTLFFGGGQDPVASVTYSPVSD